MVLFSASRRLHESPHFALPRAETLSFEIIEFKRLIAALLSGTASSLNLIGDSTHLGHPSRHSQDIIISRILSQRRSTMS